MPTEPQAPERALPEGSRLDDFEIEQVLAQGSFALVYRAYDRALNLHVAIKEYMPDSLALRGAEGQVVLRAALHAQRFELGRQAFIGEAQTLARCQHPSLLGVSRILQRHGTVYRVMRQCPGPTLLAHRQSLAAVPDENVLRAWLDGLLGALAALHDLGGVHGAVSPGNILVLPDGRPMLLDFDAVRTALISDHTQSMMAALVPGFTPSEQRDPSAGPGLGPWTDLYALAATMHFCVSGQLPPPPSGASPAGRFESLRAVWLRLQGTQPMAQAVPSWLDLVDACLAEVPQDRPQSVAQLQGMLAGAAQRRLPPPVPAPQPSLFSHDQPVAAPIAAPTQPRPPEPRPGPQTRPEPARVAAPAPTPRIEPAAAAVRVQSAAAAAQARAIAELDQTFALVAAQATMDAASAPVPLSSAEPAPAPPSASARSAAAWSGRPRASSAVARRWGIGSGCLHGGRPVAVALTRPWR